MKNKLSLQSTICPICGSRDDYRILYPANFKISDFNIQIFSARRQPDKIHYQLVKCLNDDLVRSNPILKVKQLNKLYQNSKFTYETSVKNLTISYAAALKPVLRYLKKSAQILEVGCGNGFMLNYLAKKGYKNVWGVEPSKSAQQHAQTALKTKIINHPFSAKLFSKNSFDFIFFFQTLDHIPHPDRFLAECYQLLKPGGWILTFNHDIGSFSAKLLKEKSPIIDIEHTHLYDFYTIQKLFQSQGFLVSRCYSPVNIISLRYLFHLLPLNYKIKKIVLSSSFEFLDRIIFPVKLGNLCLIAQK